MDDCISSDEDYYDSDRDSLHGLENEDSEIQWVPKGPATKVFYFFPVSNFLSLLAF